MWRVLVGALVLAAGSGCAKRPDISLLGDSPPEALTLYSLDGLAEPTGFDRPTVGNRFYGYPILGKVEVADPELRRKLVAALKDGVARPEQPAACFWPRHGIRIAENKKFYDYLICFECRSFHEFVGEEWARHSLINHDGQPVFDKVLTDAGVKLGPKRQGKARGLGRRGLRPVGEGPAADPSRCRS